MDIDTPWVADVHRFLPEERQAFFDRCQQELDKRFIKYVKLTGSWNAKFALACQKVDDILRKP